MRESQSNQEKENPCNGGQLHLYYNITFRLRFKTSSELIRPEFRKDITTLKLRYYESSENNKNANKILKTLTNMHTHTIKTKVEKRILRSSLA